MEMRFFFDWNRPPQFARMVDVSSLVDREEPIVYKTHEVQDFRTSGV
jgi:hypothetical protein